MTSSPPELSPQYDPAASEPEIYRRWLEAGLFTADAQRSSRVGGDRAPFTIVIPPPNVTAILHAGHGLDNIVQDVIIRWRRMSGDETLWLPGTDHAGIATQNVVEKLLAKEGKTRFDIGRKCFIARTEMFVAETGGTILEQLRAIGCSCDWSRTAYTLSPALSRAVREAFVQLWERGLVYRGHRVIHWCSRCLTSLSDEEAEHADEMGTLYHISYPLADDPSRSVTVATTRPETMLGDVAVAVNPSDERYQDLIGRDVILPIAGLRIPVIADAYADPAFGTGVVKITPAHDANDFEVAVRHTLPMPLILGPAGEMAEFADAEGRVPAALRGLDRFEARDRIVEQLRTEGRLVRMEPHQHSVRHCYRCDTVVEPRLSDQWFVRMEPLARPALAAVREGRIRIVPERWNAVYVNWLEGIRDWNISRQLWWGHRIPVWYCDDCDPPQNIIASREDITECPHCGGAVRQDEDVFDTWFSSGLWPFSTLGWPDDTPDFEAFYPTDMLVTGPDILFFWVARMIMFGYAFTDQAPFHTVYLHGIVRDTEHRKMSKSLGNGIDPLDVVRLYGADALRFTLIAGLGLGTDVILDPANLEKSFAAGRNFATKLWNIGRFLLSNVGEEPVAALDTIDELRLTRADRWILERLDVAIAECDAALGPPRPPADSIWPEGARHLGLRLNEYAETARRFVWNELADWYVETVKARVTNPGGDRDIARAILTHTFDAALRLLHPIVPFITEALWQRLPGRPEGAFLATAAWPRRRTAARSDAADDFELVRETVSAIRQVRAEYAIPPGRSIDVFLVAPSDGAGSAHDAGRVGAILDGESDVIGRLAKARVRVGAHAPKEAAAHVVLAGGAELVVPLAGLVDVAKECQKLRGELEQLTKQLGGLEARLANEIFVARAKPEVVQAERTKHTEWTTRRDQLSRKVQALCGA
jgi:valyl-tRNA synthetase